MVESQRLTVQVNTCCDSHNQQFNCTFCAFFCLAECEGTGDLNVEEQVRGGGYYYVLLWVTVHKYHFSRVHISLQAFECAFKLYDAFLDGAREYKEVKCVVHNIF